MGKLLSAWSSAEAISFHSAANQSAGCASVRTLFAPLSCAHFVSHYFEQRHLLSISSAPRRLAEIIAFGGGGDSVSLLRVHDLAPMAAHWKFKVGVDHSQARLLLPNSFSHDPAYAEGDLLDGEAMASALRNNRTVVLHNVELYWRPIGALALALMRNFGVYSQANVYYSAPGLPSAVHAHQDAQSVFIVQCEGRKRWQLFAPPQRWRLRFSQRGKAGDAAPPSELTEPLDDVILSAGDVLFVPRGMYHSTSTLFPRSRAAAAPLNGAEADGALAATDVHAEGAHVPSLHVTVGVETDTDEWTWLALLRDAAEALKLPEAKKKLEAAQWHDEALRQALPLPLCRPAGSFDPATPLGARWLGHARELLKEHLLHAQQHGPASGARAAKLEAGLLRRALDDALRPRQDLVERKRRQVEEFMALSPPV